MIAGVAALAQEDAALGQPALKGLDARPVDGDLPRLAPFTGDPDKAGLEVQGPHVAPDELADAEAGGVEQVQDRPVTQPSGAA